MTMETKLLTLTEQYPHLKDLFLLYGKADRFWQEVTGLLGTNGTTPKNTNVTAYPRDIIGAVLQRFSAAFELPEEPLAPLRQALEAGDIDFTRLPFNEVPAFSLPYPEEELATILFLLSRPFFRKLRDACTLDDRFWEEGRCPVCAARPALSSITDEPKRRMHCSYCGTTGPYLFLGCPVCRTDKPAKLGTLAPEKEEGFRVMTCDECGSYIKSVDARIVTSMSPDIADLASLPLDIIAQGKGFTRHAPNPIGLRRMK